MKGVTKDGTERNHFGNLKASAPLLHRLREKDPAWWRLLKSQRDCYIDIRKDNTVNVYHNGGSMFRIGYDRGRYTAKTHANYLGLQRRSYADFSTDDLSQEVLDRIKAGIRRRFSERSESGIKARLVLGPASRYIDTEFAFTLPNPCSKSPKVKYDILRIDLIRLNDQHDIEFVELKRIGDNRLLDKQSYTASTGTEEIVSQMDRYNRFLADNRQEIIGYYTELLKIKASLGLLPVSLTGTDFEKTTIGLSERVVLHIDIGDYDEKPTPRRAERRRALRELCSRHGIVCEVTPGHTL